MACHRSQQLTNFMVEGKKIVGVALNYIDMVRARKLPVPSCPLVFMKPTTSYLSEGQAIVLPKVFTKVAHEVELGVIMGKRGKNVSKSEAMNYVGGYCLAMDLTAYCYLAVALSKGHPWILGQGFDTSTPVSNFISRDRVKDPHSLPLWLKVNGELKQQGCTADMIFKLPDIISYVSRFMTLEPNDLILTGTPSGSAAFKAGDVIECGMSDLATMKFQVCGE